MQQRQRFATFHGRRDKKTKKKGVERVQSTEVFKKLNKEITKEDQDLIFICLKNHFFFFNLTEQEL